MPARLSVAGIQGVQAAFSGVRPQCGGPVTGRRRETDDVSEPLPDKGFFGYEPALEAEVFDLLRAEYGDRDPATVADNWRWMFVAAAERLGVAPPVWVYRKAKTVVAHQGAIPVSLKVGDQVVNTGWFVETLAAESVRGSPVGPMLIKKALEDMPLNLSLGQTAQMRELQFAMGWHEVAALEKYVFVSGYRMNLRNKLPPVAAELAAVALGIRNRLRWRAARTRASGRLQTSVVERFGPELAIVWERMAATVGSAVVRDPAYLNWKYADRRYRSFTRLVLSDNSGPVGIAIVMTAEPNAVYPYRRGYLVDLVAPLDQSGTVAALIAESVGTLIELGAQSVTCQLLGERVAAELREIGFMRRDSHYRFLVATGGTDAETGRQLLDPNGWFVTLGDSDADAYPD